MPGRPRGGFGTELHLITDGNGVPLAALLTAGQAHRSRSAAPLLGTIRLRRPGGRGGRPRSRPKRLAGDKGYSYRAVRRYLRRRGVTAVIPPQTDQKTNPRFDRLLYRRRTVIERSVGWLKENRRVGTRNARLAVNFLAMVKLAMIRRSFHLLRHSPDKS